MKILHAVPSFSSTAGGLAYALKNIADSLADFDIEQTILTAGTPDLDVEGVDIVSFPHAGSFSAHRDFKAWLRANVEKFDLVHIHSIWLFHSRVVARAARRAGIPYVVSPHGMLDDWSMSQKALKKGIYLRLFEKKVLVNAAALHCTLNAESGSRCITALNVPVEVIPLAVEDVFFSDMHVERNPNQILFLGRLHYKKQPDVLIKAFSELRSKRPELTLVIAGEGESGYVEELKKLGYANDESIAFVGMTTGRDKVKLFRASGFFALPSLQENFGIAVAEAMAAGAVPVISREVALSAIVADHQAGFVSETSLDSFQATLAAALEETDIGAYRSNCQEYALRNFSQSAVGKQFSELYRHYARP